MDYGLTPRCTLKIRSEAGAHRMPGGTTEVARSTRHESHLYRPQFLHRAAPIFFANPLTAIGAAWAERIEGGGPAG